MKLQLFLFLLILLLSVNSILLSQSSNPATLREFQSMVEHDEKNALIWWYSWIGGYTAATIGQGIVNLSSDDRSLRQDMALGAVTTFFGAVGTLFTPVVPGKSVMRKYGFQADDSTHKRDYFETVLKEISERERAGRSWKVHAVTGVFNLGSGLVTWLGFNRTVWDGVLNFAMNSVITEAQIWSQPVGGVKDHKRYGSKISDGFPPVSEKPESTLFFGSYPGGFVFRVAF